MENNPVMQRVLKLSEQWKESVQQHTDVRLFCWLGRSNIEYKTLEGFALFQTSLEKTLDDVFIVSHHPYEPDSADYSSRIFADLHAYFEGLRQEANYAAQLEDIEWKPTLREAYSSEIAYFLSNATTLAESLGIAGVSEYLVFVLFPNGVSDRKRWISFLHELAQASIPPSVRFMLYDHEGSGFYSSLSDKCADKFMYLKPDLDMSAAMHEILEEAKASRGSLEDKDMITFQQNLVKMNEATGFGDEESMLFYKGQCLELAYKWGWVDKQALVFYFLHAYYASQSAIKEGVETIDAAIALYQQALDKNATNDLQTLYHYLIAKGNLYFFNKLFSEATAVYSEALSLSREGINVMMLAGIYQMLGNSKRHSHSKKEANTVFEEGWSLVLAITDMPIQENVMAMFYADDWTKWMRSETARQYYPVFEEYWGHNWQRNIKKEHLSAEVV